MADEYANIISKYGHWKDVGTKVVGTPAWSYCVMFLRTLQGILGDGIDYLWYKNIRDDILNDKNNEPKFALDKIGEQEGYILGFADGPDNRKSPTESTYIQTINYAKEYVYITTPYFVIGETILAALLNSARSGVDVRIILPHIPDNKIIHTVTRSFYEVLLEAGVKVYEYEPGFIHAKTFVSDDEIAIIGTANLDFRSLHLNFECGTLIYKTGVEDKLKKDFLNTVEDCVQIDLAQWKKRSIFKKMTEAVLSAFAPML
ncbi:Cardiolipin synthase [compost metagenome]